MILKIKLKAHVRQLFEKLTVSQMEDPLLAWARTELENIPNAQEVSFSSKMNKTNTSRCSKLIFGQTGFIDF